MCKVSRNQSSLLLQVIMYSGDNDGRDLVLGGGNLLIAKNEEKYK